MRASLEKATGFTARSTSIAPWRRRLSGSTRRGPTCGLTQDLLPLVGPVPARDGTWVAAGYSGHGNVLGFMCGELVASAILGAEDPLLELFSPARLLVSG